jgi:hypothetical protein
MNSGNELRLPTFRWKMSVDAKKKVWGVGVGAAARLEWYDMQMRDL